MGTSRSPASSTPHKRISSPAPPQKYKKGHLEPPTLSPNLASPSYRTCSYYTLNSPAPFWNLLPPTWNLGDDVLKPPTPSPKKKCQRNKWKAQPIKHRHTYATFCQD